MEFEQLRPHQQKAVTMLRELWRQNRTHQIQGPVGMGKTEIATYLAAAMARPDNKVVFVVPYTVLVSQTAERFQKYGLPKAGIIWRDHPDYDPSAAIQIASADTLIRRDLPDNIGLMIIDESHIRRVKLLEIIENSDFPVIGLSGTPFSPWMGKYYESFIKPVTMRELIDQGYLSDYEFYAPMKPDLSNVKTSRSSAWGVDYKEEEVAEIMQGAKIVGNIVENWLANGRDLPTICFCVNVAHANHTTNGFNNAGVSCEVITAKTPFEERQAIFSRFSMGVTKILCNVGTLVAGFDADVRCIIYARPTKSEMRWIQCLGRGLRSADGKESCLIFDHSGTVHRLGFPDEIEYDELLNENDGLDQVERLKKEVERLEKLPKECPKCKHMKQHGEPVCPKCGFKPLGGEDVETDETRQIEKLSKKISELEGPTREDKQQFYSMLMGLKRENAAKGKAYKDGFYNHKFKAKFGEWPNGLHPSPMPPSMEFKNWIKSQSIRNAKRRSKPADREANIKTIKDLREMLK